MACETEMTAVDANGRVRPTAVSTVEIQMGARLLRSRLRSAGLQAEVSATKRKREQQRTEQNAWLAAWTWRATSSSLRWGFVQ